MKQIYFEKIKIKLNELKNNDSFEEIKYIPIIIAGKSRIGKSALINTFLKEKRAKEDEAQVCTLKPANYYNEKVCIFKMIDTRGIELYKQYGIENIFNDIKKFAKIQMKLQILFGEFLKVYLLKIISNVFGIV